MKKLVAILVLFFVTFAVGDEASPELGITKFVSPDYPVIARQAQVSGDVHLTIRIATEGVVESASKVSGPEILADYAQKNVQTWRFTRQSATREVEVVYSYRLREPKVYGNVVPSVSLDSPTRVVIVTNERNAKRLAAVGDCVLAGSEDEVA